MRIRVGTYNLQDLFASVSVKGRRRAKRSSSVMAASAKVIRDVDADFLALQEVNNARALADFNRVYLSGQYAQHELFSGNSDRGIHLAMLMKGSSPTSRFVSHRTPTLMDELAPLKDLQGQTLTFRRDFLQIDVRFNHRFQLTFFLAHLKSQHPLDSARYAFDADCYRRAEAQAGRQIIERHLAENPGAHVILMGDFNDGDAPKSTVAPLVHALNFFDPLRHEWPFPEDRWTAEWKRFGKRRYDYVLLSSSLKPFYVEGSADIHRHEPAPQASDHRLVSIVLDLPLR